MRYLSALCALALPALATAQVTQQSVTNSPEGEKRVVRQVMIKDELGRNTLVEQHLIELENGDYIYLHGSQPSATQDLDARMCASFGMTVPRGAIVRISPETLGAGSCHRETPSEQRRWGSVTTLLTALTLAATGNA
jgi:hypothetical protein